MAFFRCKMCGGELEIKGADSIMECKHCGTTQTLPKLYDERTAKLYDRANHYRRNNQFDKASALYEEILNENPEDAESYWSLILCKYGIKYGLDTATGRQVPTMNRTQYTSVFDDENYKQALNYADVAQKVIYR